MSPDLHIREIAPAGSSATSADLETVEQQLGRLPRGVQGIGARDTAGTPLVVITSPRLEDGTPFPTLFYLTDPELVHACSVLEAEHLMQELSETLPASYATAHIDYLQRRKKLGDVEEIKDFSAGGMPERVKCLHALVAHSLAVGPGVNPIGDQVLEIIHDRGLWSSRPDWSQI